MPVISQVVPGTGTGLAIAVSIMLGVLLGASVLAHELGHCWRPGVLGMQVVGVRLYLLGGVSELQRVPRSPREEAVIAAAGPAVSARLAGLLWLGGRRDRRPAPSSWLLVMLLALSNLVVAVFNLLPALPLDGGRVLRAGVWRVSGNRRRRHHSRRDRRLRDRAWLLVGWAVAAARRCRVRRAAAGRDRRGDGLVRRGRCRRRAVGSAAPGRLAAPASRFRSLARPVVQLPDRDPGRAGAARPRRTGTCC